MDSTLGISPDAFETVEERPCIGKKRPKKQQRGRKCADTNKSTTIDVDNQVQVKEVSRRKDKSKEKTFVKNFSTSSSASDTTLVYVKEEPQTSDDEYPHSNFPKTQTSNVDTYSSRNRLETNNTKSTEKSTPPLKSKFDLYSSKNWVKAKTIVDTEETVDKGDSSISQPVSGQGSSKFIGPFKPVDEESEEGTEEEEMEINVVPVRPITTALPQLKILLDVDEMKRKFCAVTTCEDAPKQDTKKVGSEERRKEVEVALTEEDDLGYDDAPSPASTLGAVEENQMDIELSVDDILDGLPNLPDDDTLSPEWSNYVQSLTETIKTVANSLRDERNINERQSSEITSLNEEMAKLKHELEACKNWQNTVYVEMEKTMIQYQQYCQSMATPYMYFGYPGYSQVVPGSTPVLPNGMVFPGMHTSAGAAPPFSTGDVVVTESAAVPYGDSTKSKKLSERKRFRPKTKFSPPPVNTCVQSVATNVETVATKTPLQTVQTTTKKTDNTETKTSVKEEEGSSKKLSSATDTEDTLAAAGKSIEETLREAAESVVSTTGFQYDESSGQYYDWNLKMYYDPSSGLYFDHENGIYYYYDNEKKSYIFHSQVKVDNTVQKDDKPKVRNYDSEPSDGEIISDEESVTNEVPTQIVPTQPSIPIDPCIRVIVVQSDSLALGTLFVLTCKGGTIGRDPTCTICIPEDRVSRVHNYVMYDAHEKTYYIQDNITRNGTFLNFERLSESKVPSEPYEITHRDLIKVGETMLSFHIHCRETCYDCEPGNIQAIIARESKYNEFNTKEDLSDERKRQAKNMRKKYGLNPGYLPKTLIDSIPDRAGQRRKEHGVEAYDNKDLPITKASVIRQIPADNKGHQMLAKMGWKSGEGLGKSKTGIVNPVTVDKLSNPGKGLGGSKKTSMDQVGNKKSQNWEKARQRYDLCE